MTKNDLFRKIPDKIVWVLLIGWLFQTAVYGQKGSDGLTASEKSFVLSRLCSEVKYNFVHYSELAFDWDSLCLASLPVLTATRTDDEFIEGLKRLCVRLGDGHTNVYLQSDPDNRADWVRPFPMTTKRVGDRVFVTGVYNSDFENQGVSCGCEVLEIDGEQVIAYAERYLRPLLASSTPQWSDYAPFGGFELTKDKGTKVSRVLLHRPDGKAFTIESDRNVPWDLPADSSVFDFKVLEGNIGLLVIKSFRTQIFQEKVFDRLYEEVLKTDALVIDVRDNGGGNSDNADYVIRHFNDRPIRMGRWSSPMYIAAHASWGYPQEWYMESPDPLEPIKDKPIYKKPIALLVNATTFSSAENFCVTFRGLGRGKIIGTPTGGSTGNPIFIDLGFGVGSMICTKNEWDVAGKEFIGIGIQPDVEVKEGPELFLQNKDAVLEKAKEILQGELLKRK